MEQQQQNQQNQEEQDQFDLSKIPKFFQSNYNNTQCQTYLNLLDLKPLQTGIYSDAQFNEAIELRTARQIITSQSLHYIILYLELLKTKYQNEQQYHEKLKNIKIGLVGCGVMGRLILNSLLVLTEKISVQNIHVSTRKPDSLNKYEQLGVNVYFDNEILIEKCDIVLFCIPPSQDNWGLIDMVQSVQGRVENQNKLKPLIISLVSNVGVSKLEKIFAVQKVFVTCNLQYSLIEQESQNLILLQDKVEEKYEKYNFYLAELIGTSLDYLQDLGKHLIQNKEYILNLFQVFSNIFGEKQEENQETFIISPIVLKKIGNIDEFDESLIEDENYIDIIKEKCKGVYNMKQLLYTSFLIEYLQQG